MDFYALSALVNGISSSALGIFVYFKNRNKIVNKYYGLTTVFIGIWSYSYFFWQISPQEIQALFWCRMLMIGAIFIPPTYLHFVLSLLDLNVAKKRVLYVCYFFSLVFFILNFSTLFVKGVSRKQSFSYWPDAGIAYAPFLLLYVLCIIYAVVIMWQAQKKSSGIKKAQIRYVILGAFLGFGGGATNYPLWFNIPILPVGNILVSFGIVVMAYGIYKYRLLDINIAITRATIFIFVYAFVLGIPFLLGYHYGLWQIATGLMLILASAGPFIYQYLRKKAEDSLLKHQRRYQAALRELSKTMTRIRDLDQLLKAIVLSVVDTVKVNFAGVYLKDEEHKSYQLKHYFPRKEEKRFAEYISWDSPLFKILCERKRPVLSEELKVQDAIHLDSGLVIPCFIEDNLLGFLVLGPKPQNQIYTPDDLVVFETLSYSTSLAIENCRFWQEIENRQRKARLQEMDTYSYSLAHEIDNPIQVVLGQSTLLKNEVLGAVADEEKRKGIINSFDFILEAARRVSGMVKAIRDFGQQTTGEFKPVDIEDVVESFMKLYYPKFKEKSVYFEKISSLTQPAYVRGEKPQLMQVLFIIADNAVHAMTGLDEKKTSLKIETVHNDWVRISFSDNGYGIRREMLEIIFSSFTTTKASTEGTGMGLYNAKNIVLNHKGRIWAESEGKGAGATFIVELPIAKGVTKADADKEDKGKGRRLF
jgi:signal transduction histidine kinase